MFLNAEGTVVYSASDLTAASTCEWAVMRALDARLGRIETVPQTADDMLERTARLGDLHEELFLARLRAAGPVVEIERPERAGDPASAVAATTAAFEAGAPVVFQAAFFDGRFLGYADFIIRTADGVYEVYDTKLARHAKITALLQLAAYSEQLQRLGIPIGEQVYLVLGDNSESVHLLADILPVYRKRRVRLEQIIDSRLADAAPTEWGDPRYVACGRCAVCEEQVQLHRDLLLVAGVRVGQRARLWDAGITTIDALASSTGAVPGIADRTIAKLRSQAALQLEAAKSDELTWRVEDPTALGALPVPDDGDIFFDFEGDPLHQEGTAWGLDYLFGLVEGDGTFRAFWAHDLAGEKQALLDFLDYVTERRQRHPLMHVYHYASYERTHLLSIAARHGVGENAVDDLLRQDVLVDLYPVVTRALQVGSRSYSLKKLEPLYMGDHLREGVANAADSITEYVRSRDLLENGEADAAQRVLDEIADYNEYDCLSTLRLRDWLLDRATEHAVPLAGTGELPIPVDLPQPDPVYVELAALVSAFPVGERDADQTALALASAAIDYHRREAKAFWWEHFSRLANPVDDWADTRGVMVVDRADVLREWSTPPRARSESRVLRLSGTIAPGTSLGGADAPYVIYDEPFPPIEQSRTPGSRSTHNRASVTLDEDGEVLLTERVAVGAPTYDAIPLALAPSQPPNPGTQVTAISEWGRAVLGILPSMLPDAALDILRRRPPRGFTPGTSPGGPGGTTAEGTTADQIRDALLALDHSYLAVQGPPGTGKTWNGARVIADLVQNHGWKVGVVAQSHATVENMLAGIVKAGLDPALVGKEPQKGRTPVEATWTVGDVTGKPAFVTGGTAWLFSNAGRIARGSLDLLVIDEAGQFSLAATIASSVSATRLLLLGDPQQLPQVSQGTHPEPVDVSALGWLSDGHDVLPPTFGFFLAETHRMHPALCAPVSALSYEGRLYSVAVERSLEGIEPGLHPVPVRHEDRSTSSPEEADAVVATVRSLLGRRWTSAGLATPLTEQDIIVVAPYNAQVQLVRETLAAAGFGEVPVGTADRFQGKEAAVSIVSLAASSATDVPRGLDFLLLANRLNVAISRAQLACYLVHSPALTESLPTSVAGLAQLSAFIRLVEPAATMPATTRTTGTETTTEELSRS